MRIVFFLFCLCLSAVSYAEDVPLHLLTLPSGFNIDIYAEVPKAREMALGPNGVVFVGSLDDKVYAVIPDKKSKHGTRVVTVATGLNAPNGVAFHQGALYIAEIDKISRLDEIEKNWLHPPKPIVISQNLPKEKWHGLRFIAFGPDSKLYIGVGVPCNVCLQDDKRFGTIMRMNADGSESEIYAKGIRNSVGFDWDPLTQELWFTDNGRDLLGDNTPPDKLSHAPKKGMDFGFPYFNGKGLPDPEYGKLKPNLSFTPPLLEMPAHVAALGMSFYTGTLFPASYQNQIFIAQHGSWNRSKKVGYQVVVVKRKGNQVVSVTPFVSGWLQGQKTLGRPVDTLVMPDGALLISDDYAGLIYRVSYQGQ